MISPSSQNWLRSNAAWLALALAFLLALTYAFMAAFRAPENMAAPTFGTAWAPYSDSLGPWLLGGLSFLLDFPAPDFLYRPSVGLFWASILAVTGRTAAIPALFTLWLLAMFAAATLSGGESRIRNGIIVGMGICTLAFPQAWSLLFISSLNVDLPALALTGSAVLLLVSGRGPQSWAPLLVGCVCLGIAAAMRGPMMLAGVLMIAMRVFLVERAPARVIAAAVLLFLAPLAVDMGLQRHLGVSNNGVISMYCFYTDPTHAWSPACHLAYLAAVPTNAQVALDYLRYLVSVEGIVRVLGSLSWRLMQDLAPAQGWATLGFLACAGFLAGWSERNLARRTASSPVVRALALVALLVGARLLGAGWGALAVCCACLAAATALRLWRTAMCLVGYLLGTLFLCMLGLHLGDRLQHTFTVCLYLGLGLLLLEAPRSGTTPTESPPLLLRHAAPLVISMVVATLYLANYIWPSHLREVYQSQVRGRPGVAIKLTGDPRINRSLYFSGERALFFTLHDPFEVGSVMKYRALADPDSVANASFLRPNAFVK